MMKGALKSLLRFAPIIAPMLVVLSSMVLMESPCYATPATVSSQTKYNVYYGHLHNHTKRSDGTGTPDQAYAYARDIAKLDFFGIADHAERLTSAEWAETKTAANDYNQDGTFATFWGFEWSSMVYGHVTVVNTDDFAKATSCSTNSFRELVCWLSKREGVAFFNHPGRENDFKKEFRHFRGPLSNKFVGIELWNKNHVFDEYYYNDGYYKNDGNKGFYDEALPRGWKIGASGSSDNHKGTWGTDNDYRMAVLATAKTRPAIYDAIKARRFFSTLDKNLTLSFEIDSNQMGSVIGSGTHVAVIKAGDADSEIFTKIELLKNGTVLSTWNPNTTAPDITQSISAIQGDYFYVRVKQADGGEAISSPIFVN